MKPREARRAWREDIKRRKAQALVIPDDWKVEFADKRSVYVLHLHTHRFIEAVRAFADLEVTDGQKKRLLRNGRVIDRVVAPIALPVRQEIDETLPIAL